MTDLVQKVTDLIGSLESDGWSPEDLAFLSYVLLVRQQEIKALYAILDESKNRKERNDEITRAVQAIKGKAFGFSGHGMIKLIDGRFDDEQKRKLVRLMYEFSLLLRDRLEMQSFITSGTLLGLVREGRFLAHDDDFDMAYVSNETDKAAIIEERKDLFKAVNSSDHFRIEERTGGRAAVFVSCFDIKFNFDLFAAYRNGKYFNEFPLKPDEILFEDITPVRVEKFYGEDIFVPNKPEKLLEVNYGPEWSVPDPAFRFPFGKHRGYYNFLIKAARTEDKGSNQA